MRKPLLATLLAIVFCVSAFADDVYPTVPNLDGYQYVAFAKAGSEGFDPEGTIDIPLYVHLVQADKMVYGSLVLPAILAEGFGAPSTAFFGFEVIPLYDGQYQGKTIIFKAKDDEGIVYEYSAKVLKKGKNLKLTITDTPSGDYTVLLHRVNDDGTYLSGIYLGNTVFVSSPSDYTDNSIFGIRIVGTQAYGCGGYYAPGYNKLMMGVYEGTYDPDAGQLDVPLTNQSPGVTGTFSDGKFEYRAFWEAGVSPVDTRDAVGTTYFFSNSPLVPLKAKRIKPRTIGDGATTDIKLYHNGALPGCVVRLVLNGKRKSKENVRLYSYTYGEKYITLRLEAPGGVKNKYNAEITNPNGEVAACKKILVVK